MVAVSSRPPRRARRAGRRAARGRRSRSRRPPGPAATARPKLSEIDDRGRGAETLAERRAQLAGRSGPGPRAAATRRPRPARSTVDAGVRAHEPVLGAHDQHAALGTHHLGALVEDHLHQARVLVRASRRAHRARADGSTCRRSRSRPSAFETTFCATTSTSPSPIVTPARSRRRAIAATGRRPGRISGSRRAACLRERERSSCDGGSPSCARSARSTPRVSRRARRARCASALHAARRGRRRVSTSSASEGTSLDRAVEAARSRLLDVALERAGAELRLNGPRGSSSERVGAAAVAVGHDHDVRSPPRRRDRARPAPPGRAAGSRPAPAAPARSRAPRRAPVPSSAACDWPFSAVGDQRPRRARRPGR